MTGRAEASQPAASDVGVSAALSKKSLIRIILIAFSLANLCLITAWFASHFDKDFGYFNKLPVSRTTMAAMLINRLFLTLLFGVTGYCVERSRNRFIQAAADLSFVGLLIIPLDFVRTNMLQIEDYRVLAAIGNPFGITLGVALLAALIRWHRTVARITAILMLCLSPMALLISVRSLLVLFGIVGINQDGGLPRELAPILPVTNNTRVVWIIFDEMDYHLAFANRPPNLELPNLTRLSNESFSSSQAYPPAGMTVLSIPSLTTGQAVSRARPVSPNELLLVLPEKGKLGTWSRLPSVFSDARSLGFNSAVAGWYHPYGRLFDSSLSDCAFFPLPGLEPARTPTVLGTMRRELFSMVGPLNLRYLHLRLYQECLDASRNLVTNSSFGLTFLHFPIPHKPGICHPEDQQLTWFGVPGLRGFLGNLVLADKTLGMLRHDMELAGLWNKTWVIVSSDHWFRQRTRDTGSTDFRIPFIVKAPRPVEESYTRPFNTRVSYALIGAILEGSVTNAGQLSGWLDTHHIDPPASYTRRIDEE